MRRPVVKGLVAAAVTTVAIFAVEGICCFCFHTLPFSVPIWGGEVVTHVGLTWMLDVFYPLCTVEEALSMSPGFSATPSPFTIVIFLVLWLVFALIFAAHKRAKRKKAED